MSAVTNTNVSPAATLRVTRLIKAPRERVFAAWTTPEQIMKWFGPQTCQVLSAEVDLRVGGQYHFRVKGQSCDTGQEMGELDLRGVYREVKRPARLVYTWGWHGNPDVEFGETIVTVDFLDKEGFTEVQITHDKFPNTDTRDRHNHGWNGSLDKLERHLSSGSEGQTCPEPGTFCWNELLAVDPGKAKQFYTKLFGWTTEAMPGGMNYTLFKQGSTSIGGLMPRPNPQAPPHWLPYVMVESVDDRAKQAADLGARILMPPTDIPTIGRIAVFMDPDGAPIGIFQPAKG
jgi:uncharacterized protein YndB with AHSA1/START domain/predicted enzyme related to lactoylglutathione lyase